MGRAPTTPDRFAALNKKSKTFIKSWGRTVSQDLKAQGAPGTLASAEALLGLAEDAIGTVVDQLGGLFGSAGDAAGTVGEGVLDFIEKAVDKGLEVIDGLIGAAGQITDAAIGAVLGLVEAIKKAIHLLIDFFPKSPITRFIELTLDLLDNILGNIAELVSSATGKLAKTFRTNMYDQLYMIRRARGAVPADLPDVPVPE